MSVDFKIHSEACCILTLTIKMDFGVNFKLSWSKIIFLYKIPIFFQRNFSKPTIENFPSNNVQPHTPHNVPKRKWNFELTVLKSVESSFEDDKERFNFKEKNNFKNIP